jgi:photosystem II stability/assembly factor-like uncharacterized protein
MKVLILILVIISVNVFSQNSDWVYRNPYPQDDFYSIKFFNQNTGYISGSGGIILKTTNGCASFQTLATGTKAALYDMYFVSQQAGFAFGENSTIIYTSSGGSSWSTIQQIPNSKTIKSVYFLDPLTAYGVGTSGYIIKTTNGGFNWLVQPQLTPLNLNCIFFQDANKGWIGADSGWVYKTTNGGGTWQGSNILFYNINSIKFIDSIKGFIAAGSSNGGGAYFTTNSGVNWNAVQYYGGSYCYNDIEAVNSNTLVMTSNNGPVIITTNGGNFWQATGLPPSASLRSISAADTLLYICGTNGWISRMNIQGTQTMFGGSKNNLISLSFLNENTGIAVGSFQLLKTSSGGTNWNISWYGLVSWFEGGPMYPLKAEYFPSGNLYLMTHSQPSQPGGFPAQYIYKSTDGGLTWIQPVGYYGYLGGMDEVQGVAYATHTWTIYKNTGSSWTSLYNTGGGTLGKVTFANPNSGAVIYSNSGSYGLLRTTNGGLNWVFSQNPNNKYLNSIKLLQSGIGYGAGDSGYLIKTTNFGSTWQQMNTGLNRYNRDMKFIDDNNGWLLYQSGNSPYNNSLYFTKNGGNNFYPITSLGSFNVKAFSFINANTGYVCGDSGVILKTTNGGLTFINSNSGILPEKFSLSQNYPNPFNPVTNIKFDIPLLRGVSAGRGVFVKLIIYDLLGREISQLVNQQMQAGSYSVDWDASNYPSGVYFYKIEAGDYAETKKMVFLK